MRKLWWNIFLSFYDQYLMAIVDNLSLTDFKHALPRVLQIAIQRSKAWNLFVNTIITF